MFDWLLIIHFSLLFFLSTGCDDFYLGFQFTASQETTLTVDIPGMTFKDWGVPPESKCASTQYNR